MALKIYLLLLMIGGIIAIIVYATKGKKTPNVPQQMYFNPQQSKFLYCSNCGTPIKEGAQFCEYCGAAAGEAGNVQQTPSNVPYIPNVYVNPQPVRQSNGLGTAGFVLALVTIFCCWIPGVGWFTWFLGLLFSFIGLFKSPKGLAIAGFILSLIDLIILIVVVGAIAAFMSAF
jgi:hypothetical protein